MKKNAFTMIELVFVIVVLGILASVAIPKLAATRDDAKIAKTRSDIASIRSAIVSERQTKLVRGNSKYMPRLSTGTAGDPLFTGSSTDRTLLMYGIATDGDWVNSATDENTSDTYKVTVKKGVPVTFIYTVTDGKFTCDPTTGTAAEKKMCKNLIN